MEIGMKIYFEKATGNVVVNTGEQVGRLVVETTEDQDFATYKALAERVRDTIGVVKLKYGQYAREFAECSGYRVDPKTLELEFTFPGEVPAELLVKRIETVEGDNAVMALELAKTTKRLEETDAALKQTETLLGKSDTVLKETQARLDLAEKESATLLLKLVEGGVI